MSELKFYPIKMRLQFLQMFRFLFMNSSSNYCHRQLELLPNVHFQETKDAILLINNNELIWLGLSGVSFSYYKFLACKVLVSSVQTSDYNANKRRVSILYFSSNLVAVCCQLSSPKHRRLKTGRLTTLTVPAVSRISNMHCWPSTSTCCMRREENKNKDKLPLLTRLLKKKRRQSTEQKLLPFCRSLLLWGHISQQKFPGQTGPSARCTDISLEPENVSHKALK